jgi:hypothetical protein
MATIVLLDGPLEGVIHEVAGGFFVPDKFALSDGPLRHWYVTSDDRETAKFERSEKGEYEN